MPGFLSTVSTVVMCAHGGQAKATVPNPRVKVMGQPIVTQPAPYMVAGCPFVLGVVPSPCVTAAWVMGAVRVKAMGMPVLLADSQAICAPNGTPVSVIPGQTRVKGM